MYLNQVDKGWAWMVCFGCFVAMFLETGIVKALGVLLPTLRQQFATQTGTIGLVISLVPGFGAITCPLAGAVRKRFTARVAVMSFGLISTVGLAFGSLVTSLPMLMCSFVTTGFLLGAEAVSLGELSTYFHDRFDLALTIGHFGLSSGLFVIPPLTQMFIDAYGWRGTMLLLSAINMHIVLAGSFLIPDTSSPQDTLNKHPQRDRHQNEKKSINSQIGHYLDLDLFRNPGFVSMFISSFGLGYSLTGWLIYLVPFALDINIQPLKASLLASYGGIGTFFGYASFPFLSRRLSVDKLIISSTSVYASALFKNPCFSLLDSYTGLIFASVLYGFTRGIVTLSLCQIVKECVNADKVSNAYVWTFLSCGIASVLSGFFSGWIYDQTGSFALSFILLGVVTLLSICPHGMLIARRRTQAGHIAISDT